MRKGIIMEINERFLTLLTPEGEFLKARNQKIHYEIGEEIQFYPLQESRKNPFLFSFFNSYKGKSVAALAVAFVIAIVSFLPFYGETQVYAYMSIDVNPSLELGLNENLQVIELTSYNDGGRQIVEKLDDWKKEDFEVITNKIFMLMREDGYLTDDKNVVIGTVHTGEIVKESEQRLDQTLKTIETKIEKDETKLIAVEATTKERDLAKESGKTAGQLVFEKQQSLPVKEKQDSKKLKEKPVKEQKAENKNQKPVEEKNINKEQNNGKTLAPGQEKKNEKFKQEKKLEKEVKKENQQKDKDNKDRQDKEEVKKNKNQDSIDEKKDKKNDSKSEEKQQEEDKKNEKLKDKENKESQKKDKKEYRKKE